VVPLDDDRRRAGGPAGLYEAVEPPGGAVGDVGELVEHVAREDDRRGIEVVDERTESSGAVVGLADRELDVRRLAPADVEVRDDECVRCREVRRAVAERDPVGGWPEHGS
jgi:hypothetical protein